MTDDLDPAAMVPAMRLALEANFGSLADWRTRCLALRDGGVRLVFDPATGTLTLRSGASPAEPGEARLLALGGAEDRIGGIDWALVYERYQQAVHAASAGCGASADEIAGALVIDVRRAGVYAQAPARIPGAPWRDPALVAQWGPELPAGRDIVVYCIYGHEVGRSTALRLRALGLAARYLAGGIDGWQAAGRPVEAKPAA
jgi:Fe-Mn family superoxide dismutase